MKSISDTKNVGKSTDKVAFLQAVLCPQCRGIRCSYCVYKGYTFRVVKGEVA